VNAATKVRTIPTHWCPLPNLVAGARCTGITGAIWCTGTGTGLAIGCWYVCLVNDSMDLWETRHVHAWLGSLFVVKGINNNNNKAKQNLLSPVR